MRSRRKASEIIVEHGARVGRPIPHSHRIIRVVERNSDLMRSIIVGKVREKMDGQRKIVDLTVSEIKLLPLERGRGVRSVYSHNPCVRAVHVPNVVDTPRLEVIITAGTQARKVLLILGCRSIVQSEYLGTGNRAVENHEFIHSPVCCCKTVCRANHKVACTGFLTVAGHGRPTFVHAVYFYGRISPVPRESHVIPRVVHESNGSTAIVILAVPDHERKLHLPARVHRHPIAGRRVKTLYDYILRGTVYQRFPPESHAPSA